MISSSRSLFLATLVTACLALAGLIALGAPSVAQTASTEAAPPEKVQELLKLLDDPEIRTWLATKSPAPAESAGAEAADDISSGEAAIRAHLVAMRNALPLIPAQAVNAVRTIRAEINNHGFATIIVLFVALLALGFGAEWLFRRATAGAWDNKAGRAGSGSPERNRALHLLSELAPLVVFTAVSAGAFLLFSWPALLRAVILTYLLAFIIVRVVMATTRALLAPEGGALPVEGGHALRMITVNDAEASFWYRRLVVFAAYLMAGWATVRLLPKLGFSADVVSLIAYLLGIGLLALAIEIVWKRPRDAAATSRLSITNWLLTIYLAALWGLWVAGLNGLLWLGIYALLLPKALAITGEVAESLAARRDSSASVHSVRTVLIVRGARALVILLAVAWFALLLRLHPGAMAEDNSLLIQLTRGALRGVVILLAADILWHLAKAYIDRNLEIASGNEAVVPAEAARRGRLRTLLPIFRNMLAILIGAVAVLMVLSELGVQIGPLIAGAGIFGVAIGFGSQTLVKDVISGVFYMLDDAFRVGEYIQSGSYKGTVESFSLRSVRLRHHRGPVFTVPFGELGAVQNMSRDWVIEKMTVGVTYDSDIDLARKLIKKVGQELAQDPDFAAGTIEPLKMQGIDNFGDFAIVLRMKLVTRPGAQYAIKRKALMLIKKAFDENGIKIAVPTVQVSGGEETAAAAAGETLRRRRTAKAAAPAA